MPRFEFPDDLAPHMQVIDDYVQEGMIQAAERGDVIRRQLVAELEHDEPSEAEAEAIRIKVNETLREEMPEVMDGHGVFHEKLIPLCENFQAACETEGLERYGHLFNLKLSLEDSLVLERLPSWFHETLAALRETLEELLDWVKERVETVKDEVDVLVRLDGEVRAQYARLLASGAFFRSRCRDEVIKPQIEDVQKAIANCNVFIYRGDQEYTPLTLIVGLRRTVATFENLEVVPDCLQVLLNETVETVTAFADALYAAHPETHAELATIKIDPVEPEVLGDMSKLAEFLESLTPDEALDLFERAGLIVKRNPDSA